MSFKNSATLFITAFLLHFVWEMWQVPFYVGMMLADHWQAVQTCSQASVGDAIITLLAFYLANLISGSKDFQHFRNAGIAWPVYLCGGLFVTVGIELLATKVLDRWQYSERMPVLPFLDTGLLPILQWLILPPIVLWIARTFARGLSSNR